MVYSVQPRFTPTFSWLLKRPIVLLGMGFGSGLAPVAPGTFGTLPALLMGGLWFGAGLGGVELMWLCAALFAWGIHICSVSEKEIGRQDYGGIVWDEIVAMLFILCWIPYEWTWWLAAFGVFRLFDALKPWPIRWFDARVHGGFGVMLDDAIAALFSIIVLRLLMTVL